jgi:hypothetical protein
MERTTHKVRKVTSWGTPGYQYGHYEMTGQPGNRRSVFKVDVHLGEHATADDALAAWPVEIARLESIGRVNKADKLRTKLDRLWELS